VFLVGALPADVATGAGLAGSEYAAQKLAPTTGSPAWPARCPPPSIDLALEARLQRLVLELARARKLASAHDVSDGGLAVALAECAAAGPESSAAVGARIDLELRRDVASAARPLEIASALFGEHPSRVVVSVRRGDAADLLSAAEKAGVGIVELGVTGGSTLSIHLDRTALVASLEELRAAREGALVSVVGR